MVTVVQVMSWKLRSDCNSSSGNIGRSSVCSQVVQDMTRLLWYHGVQTSRWTVRKVETSQSKKMSRFEE